MACTPCAWYKKAINQLLPIVVMLTGLVLIGLFVEQNMPGFIVGDFNLSYPLHAETMSTLAAFALMFIYPILVIPHCVAKSRIWGRRCLSKSILIYWWDKTWCGMFICFVFLIFSESMKRFVGKLRPNFFAMCDPVYSVTAGRNFSEGTYITNYTCNNDSKGRESARSFPSGHSLFAILLFSAMGNLFELYKTRDKLLDPTWAPRIMIQVLLTVVAGPALALTRYTEHYHQATDVLVGIILGYISFGCLLTLEKWFIVEPTTLTDLQYSEPLDSSHVGETNRNTIALADKV